MILRILLAALLIVSPAAAETPSRGIVDIADGDETLTLHVEIADEPGEHSRGLMFRSSLAPRSGMLFLYPNPRRVTFWMKNTIIPLDMLFIDQHGRVEKIARKTEPYSLEPIMSEGLVVGVLELAGGAAERLGVEVGDLVHWLEFPPQGSVSRENALESTE